MQRTIMCLGLVIIIAASFLTYGCGGADDPLLDEVGQRYTASISIKDLDEETLTVDVVQNYCDADVEDYGPVSAGVEFAVDADAPGITLKEYTLEYIPLESEDGTGLVMPPTLDSPLDGGNLGIDIASGGSASFDITCMSVDTKEEYRTKVGWLFNTETLGGIALIDAKQIEVDAKQQDIEDQEDLILAETLAGNSTDALELQLTRLQADLEELENELAALLNGLWSVPTLDEGRYKIRITFNFEDIYGVERTIVRERTVWLGNFDNC
jgi:hypothetical protein